MASHPVLLEYRPVGREFTHEHCLLPVIVVQGLFSGTDMSCSGGCADSHPCRTSSNGHARSPRTTRTPTSRLAEPCMTPERSDGSIDWQTKMVVGLHIVALVGWAIYLVMAL